ncbi:MAG: hypothetical protein ACRDIF_04230 [Actinomycetota bacterium]
MIAIDDSPEFIEVVVETTLGTGCCPKCRRTPTRWWPRSGGRSASRTCRKRRFVCRRCNKTFSEVAEAIPSGGCVTDRFAHLAGWCGASR